MPAVTMVAAWMRADTGVGPHMASGSHVKRGPCALLPHTAIRSRKGIAAFDHEPCAESGSAEATAWKSPS